MQFLLQISRFTCGDRDIVGQPLPKLTGFMVQEKRELTKKGHLLRTKLNQNEHFLLKKNTEKRMQ